MCVVLLLYVGVTFSVVCYAVDEEPTACGANAGQHVHGEMRDSAICFPLGYFHSTLLLPSR